MTPSAAIVIQSHRPAMLPEALSSATTQLGVPPDSVHVVVTHCQAETWPTKFNEAATIAKGEWLVPLCDDDLLAPDYLRTCLQYADRADLIYTDRRIFDDGTDPLKGRIQSMHGDGYRDKQFYVAKLRPAAFTHGATFPMTCCIKRSLWDRLGGYDQLPHADTEFYYRAFRTRGVRVLYLPRAVFWYREHAGQSSRCDPQMNAALRAFHQKHFYDFGVCWDADWPNDGEKLTVPILPVNQRVRYARERGVTPWAPDQ